jgi:hypothetical protein
MVNYLWSGFSSHDALSILTFQKSQSVHGFNSIFNLLIVIKSELADIAAYGPHLRVDLAWDRVGSRSVRVSGVSQVNFI